MEKQIELRNVSVRYPVRGNYDDAVNAWHGNRAGQIEHIGKRIVVRALEDISLELEPGDRLGLLGGNGSGKTTLLRIIAGILPPTHGSVRVLGRISPLLSIQLGLDNQATGLENIRIRGTFLGIPAQEIEAAIPEIAEFSELGEFLQLPISTYSSGMRLRLAFAAATAFAPEVLVMDEWLSAGDESFQRKAKLRLEKLITNSGVFIFASQNPAQHRQFCNKAMVLQQGQCKFLGGVEDAFTFLREQ